MKAYVLLLLLILLSTSAYSDLITSAGGQISASLVTSTNNNSSPQPITSSGGGGGGGGGGRTCRSYWTCDDWSFCSNGYINRSCYDANRCIRLNTTQRTKCENLNENITISKPEEKEVIIPEEIIVEDIEKIPEPTIPLQDTPIILKKTKDEECYLNGTLFKNDGKPDESCETGWCNDGIFKDTCSDKIERMERSKFNITKLWNTYFKDDKNLESDDISAQELFLWLLLIVILGVIIIRKYIKSKRKQLKRSTDNSTIGSSMSQPMGQEDLTTIPPNLIPLYEGIKLRLAEGIDKYDLIDIAKRRGWKDQDLELVFSVIEGSE